MKKTLMMIMLDGGDGPAAIVSIRMNVQNDRLQKDLENGVWNAAIARDDTTVEVTRTES